MRRSAFCRRPVAVAHSARRAPTSPTRCLFPSPWAWSTLSHTSPSRTSPPPLFSAVNLISSLIESLTDVASLCTPPALSFLFYPFLSSHISPSFDPLSFSTRKSSYRQPTLLPGTENQLYLVLLRVGSEVSFVFFSRYSAYRSSDNLRNDTKYITSWISAGWSSSSFSAFSYM